MDAFKIMTILQMICLSGCQDYDNLMSAELPNVTVNVKLVSQPDERSGSCSWTLSSSDNKTSLIVMEDVHSLFSQICVSLGCGDEYKTKDSNVVLNSSCLTGCLYLNSQLINCTETVRNDCKTLSEVICGSPYVARASSTCSWTIKSPDRISSLIVTEDVAESVSSDICHQLGCGLVYNLTQSRAGSNETCLTNCVYHNNHLKNCTEVNSSNCSVLSEVKCGDGVRLVGGGHRCGGRVEVWRGSWGTVCDDGWGMEEADVVCAQLDCGYAVSVSVQGEPYGQGTGLIHLDELNCTGTEKSLWECPALTHLHDCGHKEDAGVVCSEYKALRLTGGLDRCSGRVEIHRNGSWGTVCDTCWGKEEGAMACDMLNCGGVKKHSAFDIPFKHKNATLWYFYCKSSTKNLWQCMEYRNVHHMCTETKAAGLICNNSLGLPVPTSPQTTTAPATTVTMTVEDFPRFILSPELLGCFVLAFSLLIAVITNIILCQHHKKKKALKVQQKFANLQSSTEAEENNYRESIHLVKVTNNCIPTVPQLIWPQSSIESGSYDTDYEQNDISPEAAFPLSTFRNSMRYSADGKAPVVKATNLNSVTEEMDSFESSCTSSGECYENSCTNTQDRCSLELAECYENIGENRDGKTADMFHQDNKIHINEDFLKLKSGKPVQGHITDLPFQDQEHDNGGVSREDSPLYSPVSYDHDAVSCESEYDDIGNYLQQPMTSA
ncbi:deleted in malignant brain tumors 1 protein-like isoform X2 [Myxocyprinus asiaticus]|uniref:deleted in malignant brain tumors 1 protein-like isoform X2 n=1 Tax=Myxocyprinus asiaticus TaxID=70543 RepID=UPI002222DF56|nr:deleted in malignant brain tumors 1 protein-like isoform X2 [Myxocyprinus asiaticus]